MRKLLIYFMLMLTGGCVSCGKDKPEEKPKPTVEEIPVEIATDYRPNLRDVIRICIPHDSIYTYSDDGNSVPGELRYQIDKDTVNVYVLTGIDDNNNYVYELRE